MVEPGDRLRVIVSTDIGGCDPDDFQSMVHYLVYADRFDTEGIIASPPCRGDLGDVLEALDAYEADHPALARSPGYPTPAQLRSVAVQGAQRSAPSAGHSTATDGSRLIIERARASDPRPLWVLVWGSITDVAQALHDDPGIASNLRIYSIGSWNTDQDPAARDYLYDNHRANLFWIESDTTFRGMYMCGEQAGDLGNVSFPGTHVDGHGALGELFMAKKSTLKMGDTPSVLYLLSGDPDDPTADHWGGRFQRPDPAGAPTYFTDRTDESCEGRAGAWTVSRWRRAYLEDWAERMDRALP